MLVMLIQLVFC